MLTLLEAADSFAGHTNSRIPAGQATIVTRMPSMGAPARDSVRLLPRECAGNLANHSSSGPVLGLLLGRSSFKGGRCWQWGLVGGFHVVFKAIVFLASHSDDIVDAILLEVNL